MTGAFEHLLRNCVTHGVESPAARAAAGKDPTGSIVVTVTQEGNEVSVEFRDDGAGLNLPRIREKGRRDGPDRRRREPQRCRARQPDLHAGLLDRRRSDRPGRTRRRHGRGARRRQRDGRPHRDGHCGRARHQLPPGAAADHGGDAGGDAALWRVEGGGAVDAGGDRQALAAKRAPDRLRDQRVPHRRPQPAVLLARRAAASQRARPARHARAAGGDHPQRGAAHRAARRRSAGQPGSGGQEPGAATGAPAGPGRHDACCPRANRR